MNKFTAFVCFVFCVAPSSAFAYVGPGMGVGALGVLIGVLGSICLAVFAVVYYPVKRMLASKRANKVADDLDDIEESTVAAREAVDTDIDSNKNDSK